MKVYVYHFHATYQVAVGSTAHLDGILRRDGPMRDIPNYESVKTDISSHYRLPQGMSLVLENLSLLEVYEGTFP